MVAQDGWPDSDPVAMARRFSERVPHSRDLGMVIVPSEGPQARMRLPPQLHLLDDAGPTTSSSVLLSLADSAAGLAVFAATRSLAPIATLDLRMNYLRPAPGGSTLDVRADCVGVTDDVAFVRCVVHVEGSPEPVATGDATFMRGTRGRRFDAAALPPTLPADAPSPESPFSTPGTPVGGYVRHLGLEVLTPRAGVELRLPYRAALIGNMYVPALHGGVVGGLVEEAARAAVRAASGGTPAARVLNCDIDYHRPALPVDTHASVEIVRRTRRTALAHVTCWQAPERRVVATGRVQLLLAGAFAEPAPTETSA